MGEGGGGCGERSGLPLIFSVGVRVCVCKEDEEGRTRRGKQERSEKKKRSGRKGMLPLSR